MSGRRSYVARHRHGRPGLFEVAVLMATWPPLRPLRRRWFGRSSRANVGLQSQPVVIQPVMQPVVMQPVAAQPAAVGLPTPGLFSHRAA